MLLRSLLGVALCAAPLPALAFPIVVGVPNWPSAQVTAHIIEDVLEERMDVDVRLRSIGTVQLFGAIDRGEVDVHPEVWLPNLQSFVAGDSGTLTLADNSVPARQGLCTTRATKEGTGLSAVADLADPDMAAKFDTDGDGRGEMWIGAFEWSSTRVERVRARSYGYDETMMLLTAPEDVAMAAVDAAAATGAPVVFFCYAPHHVFSLHDIVTLEEPPHDPATWQIVRPEEDPAWLAQSTAASAWAPGSYHVGYATDLLEYEPHVARFLERMTLTAQDAQAMSYAVLVENRSPAEVAATWIEENASRVEDWTP
jgi:glycine betaine/proline transport system substrate-binding protein